MAGQVSAGFKYRKDGVERHSGKACPGRAVLGGNVVDLALCRP